jgi:hypothetical protein
VKKPRIVRRQDIRFKKSLLRFTLTFSIVFLLGLSTRYFIHNYDFKSQLISEIQIPENYSLNIDQIRPQFHRGFWPVVGLSINRFEFVDNRCPTQSIGFQDVLIQARIWPLLLGQLELFRADIDDLELNLSKSCSVKEVINQSPQDVFAKGPPVDKGSMPLPSALKKDESAASPEWVQKLFSSFQSWNRSQWPQLLKVNRVQLNYLESLNKQVRLSGSLITRVRTADLELQFDVDQLFAGTSDYSFVTSQVRLMLSAEKVQLDIEGTVREGRVKALAQIMNDPTFTTQMNFEVTKIPLSALSHLVSLGADINYLWGTCSVILPSTPWTQWQTTPVDLGECGFDGPYGKVLVQNVEANLKKIDQFQLQVEHLVLDEILQDKRNVLLSGVFSQYGVLSGQLNFTRPQWNVEGVLSEAHFVFSNNNLRDIQKVSKIPFEFKGSQDKWEARIHDVVVDQGNFDGEIQFKSADKEETQGRVVIHQLRFHPRIYSLMLNAKPTDLRVYGKFSGNSSGLNNWSALMTASTLDSEYYQFHQIKVKGKGDAQGESIVQVSMGSGTLLKESPLVQWIRPTLLDDPWKKTAIHFNELSVRLGLRKDRSLYWKRGYIGMANGWQLSSEGTRDNQNNFKAWLQWDRPDRQFLRWEVDGPLFSGPWSPQTQWVQDWLSANPDFIEKNNIFIKGS